MRARIVTTPTGRYQVVWRAVRTVATIEEAEKLAALPDPPPPVSSRTGRACEGCGRPLGESGRHAQIGARLGGAPSARGDKRHCSTACRARAWRREQARKHERP